MATLQAGASLQSSRVVLGGRLELAASLLRLRSIFRKSGHRFSEENATKSIKLERLPIQRNREAL
jgi:hypothetical protein